MSGVNDFNFVNRMNKQKVEPELKPGETAVEYLQRMEKEKMAQTAPPPQQPQYQQPHPPQNEAAPPPQEVVFYEGYKLSRDFFTCVALCIMKLNDPEIDKIFETFGFEMKDLNGKKIVLKKKKTRRKKTRRKKTKRKKTKRKKTKRKK